MTVYILAAVIVVLEIFHGIERRDLYNRIMCRDIGEYQSRTKPRERIMTAHERTLKRWRDPKGGVKG